MTFLSFCNGILATLATVAGLSFLRFWRLSRDRFFVCLALAFWLLALNWTLLGLSMPSAESRHWVYLVRLAAFVLILIGIVDKNGRARNVRDRM